MRYTVPFWLLATTATVFAQDEPRSVSLPNGMTIHTWFIIAVGGAFLAWSISYSMQLQKEALERKKAPSSLLQRKKDLLDKIADLEERKEAGKVTDARYKHEMKELRFHLTRLLEIIAKG